MSEAGSRMRIGITLPMSMSDGPGRMPAWDDVCGMARYAESAGLDSVWICDHLVSEPEDRPPEGLLEAWTILSALAASTRRVSVGTLVTCVSLRHPALLAKMAATVDGISGGRLVLGLGAGFPGLEYEWYGFPDDQRLARFEEALEIVGGLLRGEAVTTSGRFHRLRDARLLLTAMARALADEGRQASSMRVMVGVAVTDPDHAIVSEGEFAGSPGELATVMDDYAALGVDELIVALAPRTARSVDRLVDALGRRQLQA